MIRSSSHSQKYLGVSLFLVFLTVFSVYSAANMLPWGSNLDERVENGFFVGAGNSEEIIAWSDCRKVTAGSRAIYVPTKTLSEWNAFKTNAPIAGINIEACAPVCIPHACTAPAPSCEETTYGTSDSCGTTCSRTGGACACVSNGSCSASSPACGTTTYGVDNCGNSCSRTGVVCPTSGPYSYGAWGSCSASCGGGTQTRSESCSYDSCHSPQPTSQDCNTQACTCAWVQNSVSCEATWLGIPALGSCSLRNSGQVKIGRWGGYVDDCLTGYTSQEATCVCN